MDIMGEPVEESEETYTGTSYPPWKIRMYRHNTTFNNPALRHETTLADYIWDLQCPDKCYLRARAPGYNPVTKMCRMCLKESFLYYFTQKLLA